MFINGVGAHIAHFLVVGNCFFCSPLLVPIQVSLSPLSCMTKECLVA